MKTTCRHLLSISRLSHMACPNATMKMQSKDTCTRRWGTSRTQEAPICLETVNWEHRVWSRHPWYSKHGPNGYCTSSLRRSSCPRLSQWYRYRRTPHSSQSWNVGLSCSLRQSQGVQQAIISTHRKSCKSQMFCHKTLNLALCIPMCTYGTNAQGAGFSISALDS